MNKYVFCDLDYTLLDDNRNILEEDLKAIKSFEAKGNHFVICSGRVGFSLERYKEELSATELITSNGAWIYSNNSLIKSVTLDKSIIKKITKYAIKNGINVRYFSESKLYLLNQKNAASICYLYENSNELDENTIFDVLDKNEIIKFVFTSDNKDVLDEAYHSIKEMNLDVELVFSSSVFLEINASGQNKGNGIIDYCKYNNIDIKDTISIGDNDNDISMLKVTGYSACPKNAIESVKNVVNYISERDNNNNAVKEILERID